MFIFFIIDFKLKVLIRFELAACKDSLIISLMFDLNANFPRPRIAEK